MTDFTESDRGWKIPSLRSSLIGATITRQLLWPRICAIPKPATKRGSGLQEDLHSKYFLEERIGIRARSRLFEMCKLIKNAVRRRLQPQAPLSDR